MPELRDNRSRSSSSKRIRQLATLGQVMCAGGILLSLGTLIVAMLHQGMRDHMLFGGLQVNGGPPFPVDDSTRQKILFFILPVVLCQAVALWNGFRLFDGYRRGEIFTQSAADRLTYIGWAIFALAPVGFAIKMGLARTLSGASQGSGASLSLAPSISDLDPTSIAFGLMAIIIGRVLAQAVKLSEENQSFI